ncbi:MAG: cbb3-type cytochrome oxidase assembly protein CcoS [Syntrophobacteraceae bacterium]
MYYAGWLFLVGISLAVSLAAFLWGLRSGQFSDQDRARFLPLGSDLLEEPAVAAPARRRRAQSAGLLFIVLMCLAAFVAALALGLHYR